MRQRARIRCIPIVIINDSTNDKAPNAHNCNPNGQLAFSKVTFRLNSQIYTHLINGMPKQTGLAIRNALIVPDKLLTIFFKVLHSLS